MAWFEHCGHELVHFEPSPDEEVGVVRGRFVRAAPAFLRPMSARHAKRSPAFLNRPARPRLRAAPLWRN